MISLGIGSIIGGYLCGIIADKIGSLLSGKLTLVLWIFACICFIAGVQWSSILFAQMAGFMWGFSIYFLEGWLSIVISRNYHGVSEAFSVNKQLNAFFFIVFQIAVFSTDNILPLKSIMLGLALLSVPAYFLLLSIPKSEEDEKRKTTKNG
jgi:predicted MFS family arabinose efflux permease